jgi:hypothetical protein
MRTQSSIQHGTESATLADILERVLDKGVVICGDIKINLVEVELLTIQIRLLICSVDKAKEIGVDWWVGHPAFSRQGNADKLAETVARLEQRLDQLMPTPNKPGAPASATEKK